MAAPVIFESALVRHRRHRAAQQAALPDFLLQRVAEEFAGRLAVVQRTFTQAACIGAAHGLVSRYLLQHAPNVTAITDIDSVEWPALDGRPRILAEDERLPLAPESVDLIIAPLTWQLVNDLPGVLAQARRALKPDGLLMAALLGGTTLHELREAWLLAEDEISGGTSPRVAPFADVRDLGGLLQRAGFALPVADTDVVRANYASPLAMMQELKAMGGSNALADRRRVPVTRALLAKAVEVYTRRFGQPNGRVPATFEIITLTGWAPHDSQQKPLRPGWAEIRLKDILEPRR